MPAFILRILLCWSQGKVYSAISPDVALKTGGIPKWHTLPSVGFSSEPMCGKVSSMVNSEPKWPLVATWSVPASLSMPAFLWSEMSRGALLRTLSPHLLVCQHHQPGGRWASKPRGAVGKQVTPEHSKHHNRSNRKCRACQNVPFSCLCCAE